MNVNNSPSLKARAALGVTDLFEFRVGFKTSMDTVKKRLRICSRTSLRTFRIAIRGSSCLLDTEKRAFIYFLRETQKFGR